jgi:hypothetical protein
VKRPRIRLDVPVKEIHKTRFDLLMAANGAYVPENVAALARAMLDQLDAQVSKLHKGADRALGVTWARGTEAAYVTRAELREDGPWLCLSNGVSGSPVELKSLGWKRTVK